MDLYPLSRHRCSSNRRLDLDLDLDNDFGLLITVLSTTSVTRLMSCVLAADDITTDRGIPFFSVKMCLFMPSLLLSVVGLFPVLSPPKVTLWIWNQLIAIGFSCQNI
jgi:hypothetical protein